MCGRVLQTLYLIKYLFMSGGSAIGQLNHVQDMFTNDLQYTPLGRGTDRINKEVQNTKNPKDYLD